MTLLLGLLPVHYTGFIIMTVAQFAASRLHRFHYYDFVAQFAASTLHRFHYYDFVAQFAASTLHRFHYYDCCSVCCQYTTQVSLL